MLENPDEEGDNESLYPDSCDEEAHYSDNQEDLLQLLPDPAVCRALDWAVRQLGGKYWEERDDDDHPFAFYVACGIAAKDLNNAKHSLHRVEHATRDIVLQQILFPVGLIIKKRLRRGVESDGAKRRYWKNFFKNQADWKEQMYSFCEYMRLGIEIDDGEYGDDVYFAPEP